MLQQIKSIFNINYINEIYIIDLCEDYCLCNQTDYTSKQNVLIYLPQEIESSYSEYLNEVLPNVYNRVEIPDFINLDSSPCIFGDSIRYSHLKCNPKTSNFLSDEVFYRPKLLTGEINVIVYKNNSSVELIDYCLDTQFAIDIYVYENTTLPDWIIVDQMKRRMVVIYDNVTTLGVFNITIHVLSLSLNNNNEYNSSFTMNLQNENPQISVISNTKIFIVKKINTFKITFSDAELDDIQYNLICKENVTSYNSSYNNSVLSLSWSPTIEEIGNYSFELVYYDYLHKSNPNVYNFLIAVSEYSPPYFTQELSDLIIPYCTESSFIFPEAKFDSNQTFNPQFNILVRMKDNIPLDSWIEFNKNKLIFNPMSDQLNITKVSLQVVLSELISTTYSNFSFNVMLVDNKEVKYFESIPDFYATYPYSFELNISVFAVFQNSSINAICSVLPANYKVDVKFNSESKVLTIKIIENNEAVLSCYGIYLDNCKRNYTSNHFKINILKQYSPAITNSIPDQLMYVNETVKIIQVPSDLFYDKNNKIEFGITECYSSVGSLITKSSTTERGSKIYLVITKHSSFIGNCHMGITGTNEINQTSFINFQLTVYACAQKNCIACDGPYQQMCLKCSIGYQLVDDSKACVAITSLQIEDMEGSKYIIGCICCIIALFIFAFFIYRNKRSYIFITNFHIILIMSMISNSKDFKSKSFLAFFYILKGDFNFIDKVFPLSKELCSNFDMIAKKNQYELVCVSTIINFVWIIIFVLLFSFIYYAYIYIKFKENCTIIYSCIIKSTFFSAIILLVLPFEILSTYLEIGYLIQNFSVKRTFFLLLQLCLLSFLLISKWKLRNIGLFQNKYELPFAVLFLIQLIISICTFIDSLYKALFLIFYVICMQYMQNNLTFSQLKLQLISEATNKMMLIILICVELMIERGFFSEIQQQGILIVTICICYMILLFALLLAYFSRVE